MARRPVRNYKCYTLSVLATSFAVSAAVSIVLALMSPAPIHFIVTSFTRNTSSEDMSSGRLRLGFTLSANNSSPSASVMYRSIYVLVCNGSRRVEDHACIGTDVTPLLPRQKPKSSERIDAAVELEGAGSPWVTLGVMPSLEAFSGDMPSLEGILVNVRALVRFKKPRLPWANLHDINVSCHITYFPTSSKQTMLSTAPARGRAVAASFLSVFLFSSFCW